MSNYVHKLGDSTSKEVKPDFESEKAYHWMHMKRQAERAGVLDTLPHKPRRGLAETSFFNQVDRRMSRRSFAVGISFVDGKIVRD